VLQEKGVWENASVGGGETGGEDGVWEGGVGGARLECECHQVLRRDGCRSLERVEDLQANWGGSSGLWRC